jgi:hypothetical protein
VNDSRIINGVEFYRAGGNVDCQCARCGSSVTLTHTDFPVYQCAASAEWCETHPMEGREQERGAWHG